MTGTIDGGATGVEGEVAIGTIDRGRDFYSTEFN